MAEVLYTTVRARPDVPTQWPTGDLKAGSTLESTFSGSSSNIPASDRLPSEPGSCRNTTSAGVFSPSSSTVAAMDALPAYLIRMSMPLSSTKLSNSGCTRLWERPEYTVRVSSPPPPQARGTAIATTKRAATRSIFGFSILQRDLIISIPSRYYNWDSG